MLNELTPAESLTIGSYVQLNSEDKNINIIKSGSTILCIENNGYIQLDVNGEIFSEKKFFLSPAKNDQTIKINGKQYRGIIQISSSNNNIGLINIINLEDYVKGVVAREMPLGKNNENFEALKAMSICIRTYAIKKNQSGKINFDLYADTRDQVYGGVDAENPLSNRAVDETKNLVLKFEGEPALLYYHSTCGGYTESSENVFSRDEIDYLTSIRDGTEPNCIISPRFKWEETYSTEDIIDRLKRASLIENRYYEFENMAIINKFESGRVNELEIDVIDSDGAKKIIIIKGNEIRNILRTADNKNILWSTLFDLSVNSNSVGLTGYGFGHGVGLCQWGAIALSRKGWNYKDILKYYYPGTITDNIYD